MKLGEEGPRWPISKRDVIEVLEHDHREVEELFTELESLRGATTEDAVTRRKELRCAPSAHPACPPPLGRTEQPWSSRYASNDRVLMRCPPRFIKQAAAK
jgi:hypothetical protein